MKTLPSVRRWGSPEPLGIRQSHKNYQELCTLDIQTKEVDGWVVHSKQEAVEGEALEVVGCSLHQVILDMFRDQS